MDEFRDMIRKVEELGINIEEAGCSDAQTKDLASDIQKGIIIFQTDEMSGPSQNYLGFKHTNACTATVKVATGLIGRKGLFNLHFFVDAIMNEARDSNGEYKVGKFIKTVCPQLLAACAKRPTPSLQPLKGAIDSSEIASKKKPPKPRVLIGKKKFDHEMKNATQHSDPRIDKKKEKRGFDTNKSDVIFKKLQQHKNVGLFTFATEDAKSVHQVLENVSLLAQLTRDGDIALNRDTQGGQNLRNLKVGPVTTRKCKKEKGRQQHIVSFTAAQIREFLEAQQQQ